MYEYPVNIDKYFSKLFTVSPKDHTMGASLKKYLDIKIPSDLNNQLFSKIIVWGNFNRKLGISKKEKTNKIFNYMRPTAHIDGEVAYINCFPGFDYVFHYGNIIKSYFALEGKNVMVTHILPTEQDCWEAIEKSNLKDIPKVDTVVMGYVENHQFISKESEWNGKDNFLWKHIHTISGDAILLGCKHTYWGEIAGRIVMYLAQLGVKRIIYSGKLGTLNPELHPNTTIATGCSSILPNGKKIQWKNVFKNISCPYVTHGSHITVPSVLQETKKWLGVNKGQYVFVDPEIGHMAYASKKCRIEYSYIHIISDNLSAKYQHDLSNERTKEVLNNRTQLYSKIGDLILGI